MNRTLEVGLIHATAVDVNGAGLLILGRSGSGKSGLALEMIALGADLVGDDQVMLSTSGAGVTAKPAEALKGRIEARKIGILETSNIPSAKIALVVDLEQPEQDRLPKHREIAIGAHQFDLLYGADVPNLAAALMVLLQGRRLPVS